MNDDLNDQPNISWWLCDGEPIEMTTYMYMYSDKSQTMQPNVVQIIAYVYNVKHIHILQ